MPSKWSWPSRANPCCGARLKKVVMWLATLHLISVSLYLVMAIYLQVKGAYDAMLQPKLQPAGVSNNEDSSSVATAMWIVFRLCVIGAQIPGSVLILDGLTHKMAGKCHKWMVYVLIMCGVDVVALAKDFTLTNGVGFLVGYTFESYCFFTFHAYLESLKKDSPPPARIRTIARSSIEEQAGP